MTATTSPGLLSTGKLCLRLNALAWHVQQAVKRGLLKPDWVVGNRWIWDSDRLEEIRRALVEAGYISDSAAPGAPSPAGGGDRPDWADWPGGLTGSPAGDLE
jgi:hypothetical protein